MTLQNNLLALGLIITASLTSLAPASADTLEDIGKRTFIGTCIPELHKSSTERLDVFNKHYSAIRNDLLAMQTATGIEAFAETVLSLGSKGQRVMDSDAHRTWIMDKFREHVLQLPSLHRAVNTHVGAMNAELRDVDTRLLVKLGNGSEIKDIAAQITWLSPELLNRQIDTLSDEIADSVLEAVDTSLANTAAGVVGGMIGGAIADQAYSADGEYSWWDMARSWGIAIGADLLVETVADEMTKPHETLVASITEIRKEFITGITSPGRKGTSAITGTLQRTFDEHNSQLVICVGQEIGVDATWAQAAYNATKRSEQ